MAVNTAPAQERRMLRFEKYGDIQAEAERLAASGYRASGNWSLGQICDHLAKAMRISLDGTDMRAPLVIRVLAPILFKKKLLKGPMQPGFKLPESAKALIPGEVSDEKGLAELRGVLERYKREVPQHPSPFLGKMTPEEWQKLHLRHAELHLGFLSPA